VNKWRRERMEPDAHLEMAYEDRHYLPDDPDDGDLEDEPCWHDLIDDRDECVECGTYVGD
jgi:hypothetical protein